MLSALVFIVGVVVVQGTVSAPSPPPLSPCIDRDIGGMQEISEWGADKGLCSSSDAYCCFGGSSCEYCGHVRADDASVSVADIEALCESVYWVGATNKFSCAYEGAITDGRKKCSGGGATCQRPGNVTEPCLPVYSSLTVTDIEREAYPGFSRTGRRFFLSGSNHECEFDTSHAGCSGTNPMFQVIGGAYPVGAANPLDNNTDMIAALDLRGVYPGFPWEPESAHYPAHLQATTTATGYAALPHTGRVAWCYLIGDSGTYSLRQFPTNAAPGFSAFNETELDTINKRSEWG